MGRKKKLEENKTAKFSITMNEKLLIIFDEFLESEECPKRSKYISKLIRDDMEKRGKDVSIKF